MGNRLIWEADVKDWEKVSIDSYKFIIEQAKERLNEVIEESQAITKNGMTILLSYIALLSAILGYIFSTKLSGKNDAFTILVVIMIAALSAYVFSLLFKLILPKDVFYKGSPPKETFFKEVFEGLTPEEGYKSLLYNELERIQDKIERMEDSNKRRCDNYKKMLKISLLFIAITIFIIVKNICAHL